MQNQTDGVLVKGAREHNLKNIDVFFPRNKISVITGLSGSGKSSLAFDTVFAEGQRRFLESLSTYARQFVEQMKKPEVDSIVGLSPAVAIDQKSVATNPRSTVGTVTEAYDYLRLLYARVGTPHCPIHHVAVESRRPQDILEDMMARGKGAKLVILAPMARGEKGEYLAEFQKWAKKGFTRARVDGEWMELAEPKRLQKHKTHDIDLLIDRVVVNEESRNRLRESLNLALTLTDGIVVIEEGTKRDLFSIHNACPECGFSFPELEPRFFSFNSPKGYCDTCKGLGSLDFEEAEEEEYNGADAPKWKKTIWSLKEAKKSKKGDDDGEDEGVDEYSLSVCPDCKGTRLKPEVLSVTLGEKNIAEVSDYSMEDMTSWLKQMKLSANQKKLAEKVVEQLLLRLEYLQKVGAGYLSLSRPTRTLSGGEAQRIRLASQVGSGLIGVLYVLDEPSIGLHPRDHDRLLSILQEIRNRGNTIIMVEHDEESILTADHVIDMGPRAGRLGGELLATGTPQEILKDKKSITGHYLSGEKRIQKPSARRKGNGNFLELIGAKGNNLHEVNLKIPLGTFVGITGVSGSGKSTLIIDTLYRALAQHFNDSSHKAAPFKDIKGLEHLDKVLEINQKPIGRTPRSVPSTYVQLFPMIRDLFAGLPESKIRGFGPGHFSFNVKGGRCEVCQGHGVKRIEMHFLSEVYVECESCLGARYNREVLNIKFKNKSIADVLAMTVQEAFDFFEHHRLIRRKLQTLLDVGLDYMTLGQSSTTLSGGEAQRVKLSRELSKKDTGRTLYILDEPTTGLHFEDVAKLVSLLQYLVEQGNTVVVIEHQMDVIQACDHVIDLGPEGGAKGGYIVAEGTPEVVAKSKKSITAPYIQKALDR